MSGVKFQLTQPIAFACTRTAVEGWRARACLPPRESDEGHRRFSLPCRRLQVTDELGKDIFLWNTPLVKSGDPAQIGALLKSGGFESVILKVADGPFKHFVKVNGKWVESVTPETVAGLKAQGLNVFGYGFCYGVNIPGEASIAVARSEERRVGKECR